jgi:hypothetical protein
MRSSRPSPSVSNSVSTHSCWRTQGTFAFWNSGTTCAWPSTNTGPAGVCGAAGLESSATNVVRIVAPAMASAAMRRK